ncbi:Uncharacterised protein [Mycobacteroides abscessus subsp. abscessus]|uniref:hypothetical protein n=2 Tax=Mycobacteroides abscessus TaxID=36809 RepID=UPI000928A43A|nr:hypothetical protein [Mycobacteroides abscessus]WJJ56407.1 hypothetical protein PROPHICCUG48898T2_80 [Mycobacterium phage CCUG48898T-2]SKU54306.1 Uncharacterised protein [Mycobacteroides abscessus subsp. bolletii]SII92747.1 Uncharacterised protein [Mycobacteroides abscessus subsp. abscessus]SIL08456.1 Uncharacterised protein [Mycobacteroides abscessus subsp. abscessus]SLK58697.1 Uncharacterised protein [Mycobacteroides abscessus subsp. abscessus]
MSGPNPKHPSIRARRNNPKKDFRSLPADGREGEAPAWPLAPDVLMVASLELSRDRVAALQVEIEQAEDGRTKGRLRRELNKHELIVAKLQLQIEQAEDAEKELWSDLWSTPQAVIWDESHAHREVAQYVRWKVRGEQGDLKAATEARQLSDRLGLNPLALLRLRAEVEHVNEVEDRGNRRRESPKRPQPKDKPDDPRSGLYAV